MTHLTWLSAALPADSFPHPEQALREPNGLLAAGGDLSDQRLLAAYRRGIFPWYSAGEPILWWCPDPRAVLFPDQLKITRSLRKTLAKRPFEVMFDRDFAAVIGACAEPRREGSGTWITDELRAAYCHLHDVGVAHSVECWRDRELLGGLYGLAIGKVFFGESMFSRATDASKIALVYLVRQLQRWGFGLIDCQVASKHLASLGAVDIPRREFLKRIEQLCAEPSQPLPWRFDADLMDAPD